MGELNIPDPPALPEPVVPKDFIPRGLRMGAYVFAVAVNALALLANGFDWVTEDQYSAVLQALGIITGGLALGYLPRRATN